MSLHCLQKTKRFAVHRRATLKDVALDVLGSRDLLMKADLTAFYVDSYQSGAIDLITDGEAETAAVPDVPSRPPKSETLKSIGRNGIETTIHGIAHAESVAIDLFWDVIARFTHYNLPRSFYDEMVHIAGQEGRHFMSWFNRLAQSDYPYGSLAVHDGLWKSASETAGSLLSRLAIVNMLHEARGLDTFALSMGKFKKIKDEVSVEVLNTNYLEEVTHVAAGVKWFTFLCRNYQANGYQAHGGEEEARLLSSLDYDPKRVFQSTARKHFRGPLRGPFNVEARAAAGLPEDWYMPLMEEEPVVSSVAAVN
jgi:uncharacterized ferritin-like protein (DUF455 family)